MRFQVKASAAINCDCRGRFRCKCKSARQREDVGMNKRQGFGVVGFGVLALGITACEGQLPGKTNGSAPQTEKVSKNVNIGGPLFTPEEVKIAPKPPITAGTQADPIIIT